jgi:hypothetical protein
MKQTARPIPHKRGHLITTPGIYSGVNMADYHGAQLCDGPSVSSSTLRTITTMSPAHAWVTHPLNPNRIEPEETAAFILGRAAHHLLLGEDSFSTIFVARPDELGGEAWHGNKKICRAWLAGQKLQGRTVLTGEQIETIRGMARSMIAHPLIRAGILNGGIEQSYVWKCKETGLWKKARPDATPNDSGDFCDLKTTNSVLTEDLQRTIADYAYHQQGALICEGWYALTGSNASSFTLVFIEKRAPFCIRVVTLRDDDLARGEQQNAAAMATFARCLETNEWPGPGGADAEFLSLPAWAQGRIDHQLEQLAKEAA